MSARTTSWLAAAGYSAATYCLLVPSRRTAAVDIARSPQSRSGVSEPQEPTRMNVFAPILLSSSTAMAAAGQPIPVEHADTIVSPTIPDQILYSLCEDTSWAESQNLAIFGTRSGSPG